MQYGGLDVEMGERMLNKGFKSTQMRFSTVCIHLDHKRGYSDPEVWKKNRLIRKKVVSQQLSWTEFGIVKS